jgi:hypothetical protein
LALVSQALLQPRFMADGWRPKICFASILRKSRGEHISASLPQNAMPVFTLMPVSYLVVPELKVGWFVAAQDGFDIARRPAAWFRAASRSDLYTLPQNRAVGQLGRTLDCVEPTVHSGAATKQFLFAAGAGFAISGAPPFDR